MQMIGLEFWRQFNIKMSIVVRLPFYAISIQLIYSAIRMNTTPVHNKSHLYFNKFNNLNEIYDLVCFN
jgi:hypothetical protein